MTRFEMKYEVLQRVLCYWNVSPTKRKLCNLEHISNQDTLPEIYYALNVGYPRSFLKTEFGQFWAVLRLKIWRSIFKIYDLKTSFLLKFLPQISDILNWRSESRIWVDSKHVYICSLQVCFDDRVAFLSLTALIPRFFLFCCKKFILLILLNFLFCLACYFWHKNTRLKFFNQVQCNWC